MALSYMCVIIWYDCYQISFPHKGIVVVDLPVVNVCGKRGWEKYKLHMLGWL